MIYTVTHSTQIIKLTNFTLRHRVIEAEDKFSSILELQTATDTEGIFTGDTINFFADSNLILTGTVTDVEQYRIVVTREDTKPTGVITSELVIFYNKNNIRIALDLTLKPFMNLVTSYHDIICESVTHYYSDNAYTQVTY